MSNDFTIRVYALIFSDEHEILLSHETYRGVQFYKFPGGGLEWGEGILDAIKRELREELNLENLQLSPFYTTDFFVESYFDTSTQVISIYYKLDGTISKNSIQIDSKDNRILGLKWLALNDLSDKDLTFSIDKHVTRLLLKSI